MSFLPNTRVSITRTPPDQTDEYGYPTDGAGRVYISRGMPASIVETSQRTWLPSESRFGVVDDFTIRLPHGTDVVEGDRVIDDNDSSVYQVDSVARPRSAVGWTIAVRLRATRIGSMTV